jgi:hypothetical protein
MSVPGRKIPTLWTIVVALALLVVAAQPAMAYVGPGPELTGYFLSMVAWVGVAFLSFLTWPIYALLRRLRGAKPRAETPAPVLPAAGPDENAVHA